MLKKTVLTKYQVCDEYNFINFIGASAIKVELGLIDGCHVSDDRKLILYWPIVHPVKTQFEPFELISSDIIYRTTV